MNSSETSSSTAIMLVDADQDLFCSSSEAIFASRMFVHGYETALALAVVTSRAPFCPNDRAVAAVLQQTRNEIAATVADDRARWGLSA